MSDQDDIWVENKVQICMNVLKDTDFIVHAKRRINENGEFLPARKDDKVKLPKNWSFHLLNMKWCGCCTAFHKKLLNIALPFPQKLIGHDYWLSALALKFCSVKIIDIPLILYRNHEGAVSQGNRSSLLYKISYRIKLILAVYKRGLKSRSIRYDL